MFLFLFILSQLSSLCEEGNGNPLQYFCLENPMDRGVWWAAVHGVAQSWTRLRCLSMHLCIGERNGNPLQYSCLENPRDRGAWWAAIYGVSQSQTRLSDLAAAATSAIWGLPWWLRLWRIHLQCRRPGAIPGLGRSPGGENGNSLWYSFLENPMDKRAWWAYSPWGRKKLDVTEQLTLSLSTVWKKDTLNFFLM